MDPEEEENYKNEKLQEKWEKLSWSLVENSFRDRFKTRRHNLVMSNVPVSLALQIRLKRSCFGRFMQTFNKCQKQQCYNLNYNKFHIEQTDLESSDELQRKYWDDTHNFTENPLDLLEKAINKTNNIDYEFLQENLTNLRLVDTQINSVDSLKKYVNLKLLVLSSNWIVTIPGKTLPKGLRFLEFFANQIQDLTDLCTKCPQRIFYLGLGRNLLTNNSCCHLLAHSGRFEELHVLDLSENNIGCLVDILDQLKGLPYITALSLEGNPCYTCESYKEYVLNEFPKLIYLDNTKLLPEDRTWEQDYDTKSESKRGALIFTCYRLIGIPTPPKGNVVQTFHFEVELPLLEEIKLPKIEKVEEVPAEETVPVTKKKKGGDKGKQDAKKEKDEKKNKKPGTPKKEKLPKPLKGKGLYALKDEYAEEIEKSIINNNFKTEPREWNQVIQYNNPAIIIESPDNNLLLLRDTFRSKVKLKIIYTQKIVNKAAKGKKKTDKKATAEPNVPEEIILKKSTFATFYCDLRSVNWSDQYIDFIWADSPKIKDQAIPVEGSLKPEIYAATGKKGKGKDNKSVKSNKSSAGTAVPEKLPLPTILTCHVGFGLKRYGMKQEVSSTKKKKK